MVYYFDNIYLLSALGLFLLALILYLNFGVYLLEVWGYIDCKKGGNCRSSKIDLPPFKPKSPHHRELNNSGIVNLCVSR